ncbi:MAG: hypothetical protein ACR650_16225 [Methylocystis sp.]|jgi:hypothetical protein
MSVTLRESSFFEGAVDTGLVDIAGGVATIVLAICGLTGIHPPLLASIATIVFGGALVAQGGMVLSGLSIAARDGSVGVGEIGGYGGSVAILLLAGLGGVILGILALLGLNPTVLTAVSVISYGGALVLSSGAGWALHVRTRESERRPGAPKMTGGYPSAESVQTIAGFTVLVLGILGLVMGPANKLSLILASLLILGAALSITGGGLGAVAQNLMRHIE